MGLTVHNADRFESRDLACDEWGILCTDKWQKEEANWGISPSLKQQKPTKVSASHPVWSAVVCEQEADRSGVVGASDLLHEFEMLADQWEGETRNLSSPSAISRHAAALEITGLGESVVPLILNRMVSRPWFWFDILRTLTQDNPIGPSMRGDMQRMTEAWVSWGVDRGII